MNSNNESSYLNDSKVIFIDSRGSCEREENKVDCEYLLHRVSIMKQKFSFSCQQLIMLRNQIEALQSRERRAKDDGREAFQVSLEMRIGGLEGVWQMYYEFSLRCAAELDSLHETILKHYGQDHRVSSLAQLWINGQDDDDDESDDDLMTDDESEDDDDDEEEDISIVEEMTF